MTPDNVAAENGKRVKTSRRYEFVPHHKSMSVYPKRHPLVPVRDGTRDSTMEAELHDDGKLLSLADPDPIVRLDLSAEGVEFLLDQLTRFSEDDYFTQSLRYARDVARFKAWEQRAGRS